MTLATSTAILTSAYPASERVRVQGINTAAVFLGLSADPSWRPDRPDQGGAPWYALNILPGGPDSALPGAGAGRVADRRDSLDWLSA
jgi:hypothetical protein